jgi:hypothetical protein
MQVVMPCACLDLQNLNVTAVSHMCLFLIAIIFSIKVPVPLLHPDILSRCNAVLTALRRSKASVIAEKRKSEMSFHRQSSGRVPQDH